MSGMDYSLAAVNNGTSRTIIDTIPTSIYNLAQVN